MSELPLKDDITKSAIDYLKKQGYSIVEWVEFDADDESTWPDEGADCIVRGKSTTDNATKTRTYIARFYTLGSEKLIQEYGKKGYWIRPKEDFYADLSFFEASHWSYLPQLNVNA